MNLREWALPIYTVLTQLATGALLIFWVIRARLYAHYSVRELDRVSRVPVTILFLTVCIASIGAHFHLSRPFFSVLAIRNFGSSWLSREITFTILLLLSMAALTGLHWFVEGRRTLKSRLGWIAILFGLATIYSMARIYMLPTQIFWNSTGEVFSDYATMLILGGVALSAILLMDLNFFYAIDPTSAKPHEGTLTRVLGPLSGVATVGLVLSLLFDIEHITNLCADCNASARTSLELLFGLYQPLFVIRIALSVLGVGWLLFRFTRTRRKGDSPRNLIGDAYLASTLVLVGEVLGRFLFYAVHVRIGI